MHQSQNAPFEAISERQKSNSEESIKNSTLSVPNEQEEQVKIQG